MKDRLNERNRHKIQTYYVVANLFLINLLVACGGGDRETVAPTRNFNAPIDEPGIPGVVQEPGPTSSQQPKCVEFNRPQAPGRPYDPNKPYIGVALSAARYVGAGLEDVTSIEKSSGVIYYGNGGYIENENGELMGARQGIPPGLPQGVPAENGDRFCLVEDR